jgi:peptidoglycan hydrolase-like protein with peptidoglycan-binding domain
VSSFRASLNLTLSVVALSLTLVAAPAFATRTHRGAKSGHAPSSTHLRTGRHHAAAPAVHKIHGQQAIAPERVTEIQQALAREHYLSKDPDGQWDSTTEAAMQKYQADQGWQTKLMPDSRAIKKLGLGPDYSGAINAKTATFADPPPISTIPAQQASGFAQGSGVNR